jgi:hypothetical protein
VISEGVTGSGICYTWGKRIIDTEFVLTPSIRDWRLVVYKLEDGIEMNFVCAILARLV